jgi:hypothetical protein
MSFTDARLAIRIHEQAKADTVCSPRPEEGDDISGLARIFENGAGGFQLNQQGKVRSEQPKFGS